MTERSKHNAERLMQEHKSDHGWKPLNRCEAETNWVEKIVLWAVIVCVTTEVVWQLHLYLQRH